MANLNKKRTISLNNGEIFANQNTCTTDSNDCCGEYAVVVAGNDIIVTDAGGYDFTLTNVLLAAGGVNTFTDSLTATANRFHTTTGFGITYSNAAGNTLSLTDAFTKVSYGTTGVVIDTDGINLVFLAGDDLQLDNDAGNAGELLTSNGTGAAPTWSAPSTAMIKSFRVPSSNFDLMTASDYTVYVESATVAAITLPLIAGLTTGQIFHIVNDHGSQITLDTSDAMTIDGVASAAIVGVGSFLTVQYNGTNFNKISSGTVGGA